MNFVSKKMVNTAIEQVKLKKKLPALDILKFAPFSEGLSAQTLHIGPFTEEGPTVEKVHEYIEASGRELAGKHHEIYLSDIRRAAPDKWKTIIRQPMKKIA